VIAFIAFEMALLAAWKLISAAVADGALAGRPTQWANAMTASLILIAVIFAGLCVYVGSVARVGGPAMLFGLLFSLALIPAAFALRRWILSRPVPLTPAATEGRAAEREWK
jgi:hypothetical protein